MHWIKIGIAFIVTFLAVNLYFMLSNFKLWSFFYTFSSAREPNIDSIWAIIQGFTGISTQAINIITLVLFALLYFYLNIKFRKNSLIFMSFISILLFLIINKVFSPQFMLWLLPFFALYGVKLISFYTLEFSNLLVLFTALPHIFSKQDFTSFLVFSGIFVVIRHLVLISILSRESKKLKITSDITGS